MQSRKGTILIILGWSIKSLSILFNYDKSENGFFWQVPWSGVITNHSTSPFAEDMYERIKDSLIEYEVVISRWPQYTLILENVSDKVI